MKLIISVVFICIGIYLANNHPDIAQIIYVNVINLANKILAFFGVNI